MQPTNLQKDKLDLIEKIIHTEDQSTLDFLKNVLNDEPLEYQLSEDQKNIVRESAENYLSGKDKGKSWEEVKSKLLSKRNG
ncbi:MAG: hypothetical protein PHC28_14960 [Flavobacterium sp.]|uniref:hypothetical protein n=1 Tax=Flavobacterium sp. TaxID=239 RepID=UPI0026195978|nr:hypothetical protein [Flavobacterium sp.]MDD5151753.1 hypothetical protein [Flavobacterium sp.]